MYIYPDDLRAKATLWLWQLWDIGVIGVGALLFFRFFLKKNAIDNLLFLCTQLVQTAVKMG